ncbi:diphthamide biosynthesis protein 3-like [Tamandua tetradactyla]|uniref:diphthamide biosynthesis protein 3-like n=1 Tax=Tamandua tetradactyla TaxID=48850 RepID=UPI0040539978
MAMFHDEVEIKDFQYEENVEIYLYPCLYRDNFSITKEWLENGEDVAMCPNCSLVIKVIYDKDQFMCGETIPAPSTSKESVKCRRSLQEFIPRIAKNEPRWKNQMQSYRALYKGNLLVVCCPVTVWILSINCHIHLELKKQSTTWISCIKL